MTEPATLRDDIVEILSRREFQPPRESMAERMVRWIGDWIASLLNRIGVSLPGGSSGIIVWIIIVVVAGLLVWAVIRAAKVTTAVRSSSGSLPADISERHGESHWLTVAADAELRGDYNSAVRAYYRAGATRLVEAGRLVDDPGATARRWQREVREASDAEATALDAITVAFEDVWYGGVEADSDLATQVKNDVTRVG